MLRSLVAVLLLAACGTSGPVALPTAPPVPEGWVVTDKAGISIAAPAAWGGDIGGEAKSILLTAVVEGGNPGVGVMAIGPRGERQPESVTDAALGEWLLDTVGTGPSSYSRSVVPLPMGRAVAVRATYSAGTRDEVLVVSYAIPTAIGVAFLQIVVDADLLDRYEAVLPTIAALFWFGVST
jgi:hypothetical protein